MRLAIDAGDLARDRRGLGRVTRAILRAALADPTIAVTLLADRGRDVRALRSEFGPVPIARTATAARRKRYDVVWYPFNAMRFRAAAPSLVSIADAFAFTEPHPEPVARAREQRPIARAAREATRIVTLSQWSCAELRRTLAIAAEKIEVIAPAPDAFWFPALGDTLPAGIAGTRFALVVGVRESRKNARLALDACARAFAAPDELLVVVGDLSAADAAAARQRGLRAGTIAPSDALLRALYRTAAVVLVPSLAEGFGLVAVEAMACAAPVIAANASALPEATGGAAILLDPRDPDAWAHAIRALLDDPVHASSVRARAAARFAFSDRGASARATLALLRRTAGG